MDFVAGGEVEAVEDGLGEDGDDGAAELLESDGLLQAGSESSLYYS